jgi:hypothetical protein
MMVLLFMSCSDEEPVLPEFRKTPALEWSAASLYQERLLITVGIQSSDALPPGSLLFRSDGANQGRYLPLKGEQRLLTSFVFSDFDLHQTKLIYEFNDGRDRVELSGTLQKVRVETTEISLPSDWSDY